MKRVLDDSFARPLTNSGSGSVFHVGGNVANITNNCNNNTSTSTHHSYNILTTSFGAARTVFAGSREEYNSLWRLFKSKETLDALWALSDHEIPARVFELWKGPEAPPHLKNVRVNGNALYEHRGPGNIVRIPRAKFLKKMVADILATVDAVPTEYTPCPNTWEDVLSRLQEPKYRIGSRRATAPEIARMHHNAAPELRSLAAEGWEFLRLAKYMLEQTLDDPENHFDAPLESANRGVS